MELSKSYGFCLVDDYDITDPSKNGVAFFVIDWIRKGYAEVVEVGKQIIVLRKLKNWDEYKEQHG